jgi:hypothetical protein
LALPFFGVTGRCGNLPNDFQFSLAAPVSEPDRHLPLKKRRSFADLVDTAAGCQAEY